MNRDLISYYSERANEYERVYSNPDEQDDLRSAADLICSEFAGKSVIEVACGTGWWTERIAKVAKSILATDVNQKVIDIAVKKRIGGDVTFRVADMFEMEVPEKFDAAFCGFIWSHILLQDLDRLLGRVREFVKPGGTMIFIDGNPVEGTKHDIRNIAETDLNGNTYQRRTLDDGSEHLVLKNFPTEEFVRAKLSRIAAATKFVSLRYYWIATCESNQP